MDILKILKEEGNSLLNEDLEFFEIELAVGDYDKDYISKCLELIADIRIFKESANNSKKEEVSNECKPVPKDLKETNENKESTNEPTKIDDSKVLSAITKARNSKYYFSDLDLILEQFNIKEEFVEKNYSFFKPFEIDEFIKKIQFSETFLEKYFKLLNRDLIAEHQLFSESFYMKHFNELDYKIVLKKGKNPWIKKSERSSKLTVFLKLKGITL